MSESEDIISNSESESSDSESEQEQEQEQTEVINESEKEEIDPFLENFDNIRILSDNINTKEKEIKELKIKFSKDLKNLEKELTSLNKDKEKFISKSIKIYSKTKGKKKKNSTRKKPEGKPVPSALIQFFGIDKNSKLNRNEVLKKFWETSREKNLKKDKLIVLDSKAGKIFKKINPEFKKGYEIDFKKVSTFISTIYKA